MSWSRHVNFALAHLGDIEQGAEKFRDSLIISKRRRAMFTVPFPSFGVAGELTRRPKFDSAARIIGAAESCDDDNPQFFRFSLSIFRFLVPHRQTAGY